MNKQSKQGKPKASQTQTVKTTTKVEKQVNVPRAPGHKNNNSTTKEGQKGASAYANTLNDPWQHPAVPIGFGTMVGTKTATAFYRGKLTSNATDGSLTIFSFPGSDVLGAYQTQTKSTSPAYGAYGFLIDGSSAASRADFQSARPVSHAIRVTPLSSNNDKPVRVSAGLIPYSTLNQYSVSDYRLAIMGAQTQELYAAHELTNHILSSGGGESVEVRWRPQDLESFNFRRDFLQFNTNESKTVLPSDGPVCVIAVQGPNSMEFEVDIVSRYEALPSWAGLFAPAVAGKESKLSDHYASLEKLWSTVSSMLTPDSLKTTGIYAQVVYDAWSLRSQSTAKSLSLTLLSRKRFDDDEKSSIKPVVKSPSYFG